MQAVTECYQEQDVPLDGSKNAKTCDGNAGFGNDSDFSNSTLKENISESQKTSSRNLHVVKDNEEGTEADGSPDAQQQVEPCDQQQEAEPEPTEGPREETQEEVGEEQSEHVRAREALLDAIEKSYLAGICVVPPRPNGSKAPLSEWDPLLNDYTWKQYEKRISTPVDHERWYADSVLTGIGWVCGAISGKLEVLDFDNKETYHAYKALAVEYGLADIVEKIEAGYLEYTPHGVHWPYRCEVISGNDKLARRHEKVLNPKTGELIDGAKTLIETRGEGGYIIVAPTYGSVNPDGVYELKRGSIATIATITPDERKEIHNLARAFNEMPETDERPKGQRPGKAPRSGSGSTREDDAGEVISRRKSWDDILEPHGWNRVKQRGDIADWRRPGKTRGISATTNYGGSDCLYVFSSNAYPLESGKSYNKFGAFATLDHNGGFTAAARAIWEEYPEEQKQYDDVDFSGIFNEGHEGEASSATDEPRPDVNTLFNGPPRDLSLPKTPKMPIEHLPACMRKTGEAVAEFMQVPIDSVVMTEIGTLSVAVADQYRVQPKPGFVEPLNLYTLDVQEVASGKSPVNKEIKRPLLEYELEAREKYSIIIAQKESEKEAIEAERKKIINKIANEENSLLKGRLQEDLREIVAKLESMEIMAMPRLTTDDCTVEKLAGLMEERNGKMAIVSSEAQIFDQLSGLYNGGKPNVSLILKANSSDDYTYDRKGSKSFVLKRPYLTLCIQTQPYKLNKALANEEFTGTGLMARFLISKPDKIENRKSRTKPIPEEVSREWSDLIRRILEGYFNEDSVIDSFKVIEFSKDAEEVYHDFYEKILEPRRSGNGDLTKNQTLLDFAKKWHGYACRLAALFHIAESKPGEETKPIHEDTARRAFAFTDYFMDMAKIAYGVGGNEETIEKASNILDWIDRKKCKSFTKSECQQEFKHGMFRRAETMNEPLKLLQEHGYIALDTTIKKKGRPSVRYVVNPLYYSPTV